MMPAHPGVELPGYAFGQTNMLLVNVVEGDVPESGDAYDPHHHAPWT